MLKNKRFELKATQTPPPPSQYQLAMGTKVIDGKSYRGFGVGFGTIAPNGNFPEETPTNKFTHKGGTFNQMYSIDNGPIIISTSSSDYQLYASSLVLRDVLALADAPKVTVDYDVVTEKLIYVIEDQTTIDTFNSIVDGSFFRFNLILTSELDVLSQDANFYYGYVPNPEFPVWSSNTVYHDSANEPNITDIQACSGNTGAIDFRLRAEMVTGKWSLFAWDIAAKGYVEYPELVVVADNGLGKLTISATDHPVAFKALTPNAKDNIVWPCKFINTHRPYIARYVFTATEFVHDAAKVIGWAGDAEGISTTETGELNSYTKAPIEVTKIAKNGDVICVHLTSNAIEYVGKTATVSFYNGEFPVTVKWDADVLSPVIEFIDTENLAQIFIGVPVRMNMLFSGDCSQWLGLQYNESVIDGLTNKVSAGLYGSYAHLRSISFDQNLDYVRLITDQVYGGQYVKISTVLDGIADAGTAPNETLYCTSYPIDATTDPESNIGYSHTLISDNPEIRSTLIKSLQGVGNTLSYDMIYMPSRVFKVVHLADGRIGWNGDIESCTNDAIVFYNALKPNETLRVTSVLTTPDKSVQIEFSNVSTVLAGGSIDVGYFDILQEKEVTEIIPFPTVPDTDGVGRILVPNLYANLSVLEPGQGLGVYFAMPTRGESCLDTYGLKVLMNYADLDNIGAGGPLGGAITNTTRLTVMGIWLTETGVRLKLDHELTNWLYQLTYWDEVQGKNISTSLELSYATDNYALVDFPDMNLRELFATRHYHRSLELTEHYYGNQEFFCEETVVDGKTLIGYQKDTTGTFVDPYLRSILFNANPLDWPHNHIKREGYVLAHTTKNKIEITSFLVDTIAQTASIQFNQNAYSNLRDTFTLYIPDGKGGSLSNSAKLRINENGVLECILDTIPLKPLNELLNQNIVNFDFTILRMNDSTILGDFYLESGKDLTHSGYSEKYGKIISKIPLKELVTSNEITDTKTYFRLAETTNIQGLELTFETLTGNSKTVTLQRPGNTPWWEFEYDDIDFADLIRHHAKYNSFVSFNLSIIKVDFESDNVITIGQGPNGELGWVDGQYGSISSKVLKNTPEVYFSEDIILESVIFANNSISFTVINKHLGAVDKPLKLVTGFGTFPAVFTTTNLQTITFIDTTVYTLVVDTIQVDRLFKFAIVVDDSIPTYTTSLLDNVVVWDVDKNAYIVGTRYPDGVVVDTLDMDDETGLLTMLNSSHYRGGYEYVFKDVLGVSYHNVLDVTELSAEGISELNKHSKTDTPKTPVLLGTTDLPLKNALKLAQEGVNLTFEIYPKNGDLSQKLALSGVKEWIHPVLGTTCTGYYKGIAGELADYVLGADPWGIGQQEIVGLYTDLDHTKLTVELSPEANSYAEAGMTVRTWRGDEYVSFFRDLTTLGNVYHSAFTPLLLGAIDEAWYKDGVVDTDVVFDIMPVEPPVDYGNVYIEPGYSLSTIGDKVTIIPEDSIRVVDNFLNAISSIEYGVHDVVIHFNTQEYDGQFFAIGLTSASELSWFVVNGNVGICDDKSIVDKYKKGYSFSLYMDYFKPVYDGKFDITLGKVDGLVGWDSTIGLGSIDNTFTGLTNTWTNNAIEVTKFVINVVDESLTIGFNSSAIELTNGSLRLLSGYPPVDLLFSDDYTTLTTTIPKPIIQYILNGEVGEVVSFDLAISKGNVHVGNSYIVPKLVDGKLVADVDDVNTDVVLPEQVQSLVVDSGLITITLKEGYDSFLLGKTSLTFNPALMNYTDVGIIITEGSTFKSFMVDSPFLSIIEEGKPLGFNLLVTDGSVDPENPDEGLDPDDPYNKPFPPELPYDPNDDTTIEIQPLPVNTSGDIVTPFNHNGPFKDANHVISYLEQLVTIGTDSSGNKGYINDAGRLNNNQLVSHTWKSNKLLIDAIYKPHDSNELRIEFSYDAIQLLHRVITLSIPYRTLDNKLAYIQASAAIGYNTKQVISAVFKGDEFNHFNQLNNNDIFSYTLRLSHVGLIEFKYCYMEPLFKDNKYVSNVLIADNDYLDVFTSSVSDSGMTLDLTTKNVSDGTVINLDLISLYAVPTTTDSLTVLRQHTQREKSYIANEMARLHPFVFDCSFSSDEFNPTHIVTMGQGEGYIGYEGEVGKLKPDTTDMAPPFSGTVAGKSELLFSKAGNVAGIPQINVPPLGGWGIFIESVKHALSTPDIFQAFFTHQACYYVGGTVTAKTLVSTLAGVIQLTANGLPYVEFTDELGIFTEAPIDSNCGFIFKFPNRVTVEHGNSYLLPYVLNDTLCFNAGTIKESKLSFVDVRVDSLERLIFTIDTPDVYVDSVVSLSLGGNVHELVVIPTVNEEGTLQRIVIAEDLDFVALMKTYAEIGRGYDWDCSVVSYGEEPPVEPPVDPEIPEIPVEPWPPVDPENPWPEPDPDIPVIDKFDITVMHGRVNGMAAVGYHPDLKGSFSNMDNVLPTRWLRRSGITLRGLWTDTSGTWIQIQGPVYEWTNAELEITVIRHGVEAQTGKVKLIQLASSDQWITNVDSLLSDFSDMKDYDTVGLRFGLSDAKYDMPMIGSWLANFKGGMYAGDAAGENPTPTYTLGSGTFIRNMRFDANAVNFTFALPKRVNEHSTEYNKTVKISFLSGKSSTKTEVVKFQVRGFGMTSVTVTDARIVSRLNDTSTIWNGFCFNVDVDVPPFPSGRFQLYPTVDENPTVNGAYRLGYYPLTADNGLSPLGVINRTDMSVGSTLTGLPICIKAMYRYKNYFYIAFGPEMIQYRNYRFRLTSGYGELWCELSRVPKEAPYGLSEYDWMVKYPVHQWFNESSVGDEVPIGFDLDVILNKKNAYGRPVWPERKPLYYGNTVICSASARPTDGLYTSFVYDALLVNITGLRNGVTIQPDGTVTKGKFQSLSGNNGIHLREMSIDGGFLTVKLDKCLKLNKEKDFPFGWLRATGWMDTTPVTIDIPLVAGVLSDDMMNNVWVFDVSKLTSFELIRQLLTPNRPLQMAFAEHLNDINRFNAGWLCSESKDITVALGAKWDIDAMSVLGGPLYQLKSVYKVTHYLQGGELATVQSAVCDSLQMYEDGTVGNGINIADVMLRDSLDAKSTMNIIPLAIEHLPLQFPYVLSNTSDEVDNGYIKDELGELTNTRVDSVNPYTGERAELMEMTLNDTTNIGEVVFNNGAIELVGDTVTFSSNRGVLTSTIGYAVRDNRYVIFSPITGLRDVLNSMYSQSGATRILNFDLDTDVSGSKSLLNTYVETSGTPEEHQSSVLINKDEEYASILGYKASAGVVTLKLEQHALFFTVNLAFRSLDFVNKQINGLVPYLDIDGVVSVDIEDENLLALGIESIRGRHFTLGASLHVQARNYGFNMRRSTASDGSFTYTLMEPVTIRKEHHVNVVGVVKEQTTLIKGLTISPLKMDVTIPMESSEYNLPMLMTSGAGVIKPAYSAANNNDAVFSAAVAQSWTDYLASLPTNVVGGVVQVNLPMDVVLNMNADGGFWVDPDTTSGDANSMISKPTNGVGEIDVVTQDDFYQQLGVTSIEWNVDK